MTIGINQEQFLNVCETGIKNPAHKRVFEQMLACDNFISFKKLMLKRNKELEAEAAKSVDLSKSAAKGSEETDIELARSLSLKEAEDRIRIEEKYNEELRLAMKLSEEDFQKHLQAAKEIEEAESRKQDIFKQAEVREMAKLQALRDEAATVLKLKQEEEVRLEAVRQEEARIKKLIEDRKAEEIRMSQIESMESRERELQSQVKAAEAERIEKETEAARLQKEQSELLKKIQEAELKRQAEERELLERKRQKEEKRKEKERIKLQEEAQTKELRQSIFEEEKRLEQEKLKLKEEAKKIEEERTRLETEKQEKHKRKMERHRLREEKKRKVEEDRLKSLETEERKKIDVENEKIQRLKNENEKLQQIMADKQEEHKRVKKEIQSRAELGPEKNLGVKNYERELTFDVSTENEVKKVQDGVIRQQERESASKAKSSLPPITAKMGLMSGLSLAADSIEVASEVKGPETPAEREARLKAQRDKILAAKRKQREDAFKEYIQEGGADLGKKATPAVSNDELEKRKHVLMKIKTYTEDNEH